jgi:plasmid stability protein
MAQLLVRGVDEALVAQLKARAAANGRSVEAEHREILRAALAAPPAADPWDEFRRLSAISLAMTADRAATTTPSEVLQRETREER